MIGGKANLQNKKVVWVGIVLIPLNAVSLGESFVTHAIVALSALLAKNAEVKQHLADTVSNNEEESLEAEDAAVLEMGVDTPDVFHTATRLGKVRVINHQADIVRLMVTADNDLSPKQADDMVHQLASVSTAIVEELIEHIFTTTKLAA